MPFYIEDLTINDGPLAADGSAKEFDIKMGCDWAKIRSIKLIQLAAATAMKATLEIWEKDSDGYNPATRADLYMNILAKAIDEATGGVYFEIFNHDLLFHDRDKSGEMHLRLVNLTGGTASDFAIVIKCGEVGEAL